MLYLKWAAFLLPSFLMEIVGKVGAPILAFFVCSDGWFWTWARRTAWLFRNTAYGFRFSS